MDNNFDADEVNLYFILAMFIIGTGFICIKIHKEKEYDYKIIRWKNNETRENTCCICLEEYKMNEKICILNCSHEFHKKCLESWLYQSNTCPLCVEEI